MSEIHYHVLVFRLKMQGENAGHYVDMGDGSTLDAYLKAEADAGWRLETKEDLSGHRLRVTTSFSEPLVTGTIH